MIEKTPIFNVTKETFDLLLDNDLKPLFNKINTEYLYWDKVCGGGDMNENKNENEKTERLVLRHRPLLFLATSVTTRQSSSKLGSALAAPSVCRFYRPC